MVVNTEVNKKAGRGVRPTSPFLTLYKPQITSLFSITERITGILLVLVVYFWVLLLKLAPLCMTSYWFYSLTYSVVKGSVAGFFIGSLIFFILLSGVYHLVFGARYLYWDRVFGKLSIVEVNKYTPLLLGVTIGLTLLLWLL